MLKLAFEAETSHGLFIEIQNYLQSIVGMAGQQPATDNISADRFESCRPIQSSPTGSSPAVTQVQAKKPKSNAGPRPSASGEKSGRGRPKKTREEHLGTSNVAPEAILKLPTIAEINEPEIKETSEISMTQPENYAETEPAEIKLTPPPKITKEDCVTALKKVSDLPNGINKVREIFKKFGAERLGEIDEKRYHELIKVSDQVVQVG